MVIHHPARGVEADFPPRAAAVLQQLSGWEPGPLPKPPAPADEETPDEGDHPNLSEED